MQSTILFGTIAKAAYKEVVPGAKGCSKTNYIKQLFWLLVNSARLKTSFWSLFAFTSPMFSTTLLLMLSVFELSVLGSYYWKESYLYQFSAILFCFKYMEYHGLSIY